MTKFNDHHTRDAALRRVLHQIRNSPRLYRTSTEAVAEKPVYAHGKTWAGWMRANFPAWRYNATTRLWYGPLADLGRLNAEFPHAVKSDGVKQYLAERNDHE